MLSELTIKLDDATEREIYQQFLVIATEAFDSALVNNKKLYYTKEEVKRDILRCGEARIQEYMNSGLKFFVQGRTYYFQLDDIVDFVNNELKI